MPTEEKKEDKLTLPKNLLLAIEEYGKISDIKTSNAKEENDAALTSAIWYEKIRAAMEYQESHLMLKNAIFRILQRNVLPNINVKPEKIFNALSNELVWANYITPKTLDDEMSAKILYALNKYLTILRSANSINRSHTDLLRYLGGICACEIEETIYPKKAEKLYLDFVYNAIAENFEHNKNHISALDHEIQIKLAIYTNIIKPDSTLLSYYALNLSHPDWPEKKEEEISELTRSIDPFINTFERHLFSPLKNRYLLAVRNMAAPFIVMRTYILSSNIDLVWAKSNPTMLEYNFSQAYESLRIQSNMKIWRGIWRALIFVFITKLTLAFFIEIPVDRVLHGGILWVPLIANISFPPLLMFLSGASIPKIPFRNSELMKESLAEILKTSKLTVEKPYKIARKKRTKASNVFNYLLSIYSLLIIIAVIWLLVLLKFTVVSIILFFVFVSAVSFLSFRIRVNSKQLLIKRRSQDSITTLVEFLFLPFITLGKLMSDELNRLNPMMLAIDFGIEAPFKTIIKILRTWFNFVSSKKEEMEY